MFPRNQLLKSRARSLTGRIPLRGLLVIMLTLSAPGAITIQLNPGFGLSGNADALAAFQRAANEWSSVITNNITVYVDANMVNMNSSTVIGSTSFNSYTLDGSDINLDFNTVRNAMAARSGQPGNAVLAYLPTSAQVSANVPTGTTFDATTLGVLRANQRALGLLSSSDTRADGSITFNSGFAFDYDRSNGIGASLIDFQTAATHEIGHLLGFLSDVDDFDNGLVNSDNLTTLDLFRFAGSNKPTNFSEFQIFRRELRPGEPSVLTNTVAAYNMSTGKNLGDGQQAGHWQDDGLFFNPIGIMDPTLPYGVYESITAADLMAFNLIGYDIVPEPGRFMLLALAAVMLTLHRRR